MTELIVATGNPGKRDEMQAYLAQSGWRLQLKPEAVDPPETGTTFAENAALKAAHVARATGKWAIAEDSGLCVRALGGRPGIYSARYGRSDRERIQRLLQELGDSDDRAAQFACAVAVAQPDGAIALQAQGSCWGKILTQPRGSGGFGYDPVFYVPQQGQTFAQMPPATKQQLSHRAQAFRTLLPQLAALPGTAHG